MKMFPFATAGLVLLIASGCRGQQPSSGVALYSEKLDSHLSNNSLIKSSDIGGLGNGIACYTAADGSPSGAVWKTPDGENIRTSSTSGATSLVLFTQKRPQRVVLLRGGVEFSVVNEGVYTCRIRDENGDTQTLFIGIYTPDNAGGPVIHAPVFSLLTELATHPSQFTITCPSSSTPPASIVWTRDGDNLTGLEHFESSQVLLNALSSHYDNVLSVKGDLVGVYMCEVGNGGGRNSASLTVRVPSSPPMEVRAVSGGSNSVHVSWTPPTSGASGYLILYTSEVHNETVRIDNSTATSYIMESVMGQIVYTIQMLAYLELSTSLSNIVEIELDVPGKPVNVLATPTSSSVVRVQWEGPPNEANIDGYIIKYASVMCEGVEKGEVRVMGAEKREKYLMGLEEGTDYNIYVAAFNSIGEGTFAEPANEVYTLEEVPSGAPLNVTVIPSSSSLVVSWQPPDCLEWNSRRLTHYTLHYHPLPPSQEEGGEEMVTGTQFTLTGLTSFTNYSLSISANNNRGMGPRSKEVFASIVTAPGTLESVTYQPDILSVVISWEAPVKEEGYITKVTLRYYNSEGVELGSVNVNNGEKTHRLTGLQPISTYNVTLTPHTLDPTPGPTFLLVVSTIPIGNVRSVKAVTYNSTAVNVSWTPLPSQDVTSYTVYYSRSVDSNGDDTESDVGPEMFIPFPVEMREETRERGDGWGLIGGLDEGKEYQFSVVAVVMMGEVSMSGERTQPVRATTRSTNDDGGINAVIIISTIAGILLILILAGVVIIFITCCLIRRYHRSGKMEVASSMEFRSYQKPRPLSNYDPPTNDLARSQPEIIDAPTDMIAVEGERVDFKLKVLGFPPPSVLWYHNGCMVGPDYATEVSDDGGITLVSVEPNHQGTYRYTVSNSVGSIQGKVTLYVTTEANLNGWGEQQRGGMELPTVTSELVTVDQFPQYMNVKNDNGSKELRNQYLCLSSCEENHSTHVALLDTNKKYNRFLNIIPYDDNRVKLKPLSGRDDCQHDYINASYIDGYGIAKKFVATQGPIDSTVVDFWRMVWQLHCPSIVMMTNLEEGRKKCERYWPQFGTADYGPYTVTLAEEKTQADYTVRKLTLTSSFSTRRVHYVTHYQFTSWPDHKVPDCASPLLELHRKLTQDHRPNKGPIVIHCSAGTGRTGAFIALDTALGQARGERRMDIPDILTRLRNQRMKMVQTPEQYIFVHEAVLEALTYSSTRTEVYQLEAALLELSALDPHSRRSGLEDQFARLEAMSPHPEHIVCRTAMQHSHKNRSMDHLPTDQWRVVLKNERPDYIHATFACGYHQKNAFIISQAPLEQTCRDFWKMVYERGCSVIVMLSGLVEGGRVVCQQYWPTSGTELYGEYSVSSVEEKAYNNSFVERIFSVTDTKSGQKHYVSQFQVLAWSSDGKTTRPSGIVNCMSYVENTQRRNGRAPIVVHCSDGVTRSGIFCAGMAAIERCRSEEVVDVFQAVQALRQQRPGAVPLLEHYKLLHELLLIFVQSNYATFSNLNTYV